MYNKQRNSYVETSYTGVGAFSSAPAPHTNALAAAAVIGDALKANDNKPTGLNLPKLQAPRPRIPRSASITANSVARNNRTASITQNAYINASRNNSINTATARRASLSSFPKQRLAGQKSVPNLKSRRSVSDFTDSSSAYSKPIMNTPAKGIPRTIKKYVPSINGLVAVEVPNPKHPENMKNGTSSSVQGSFRRSTSMASFQPKIQSGYNSQNRLKSVNSENKLRPIHSKHLADKTASSSITKNVKRETKIFPNGTKVISTTVEEYISTPDKDDVYDEAFDDAYDGFDEDHRQVDMSVTLDDVDEAEEYDNEHEYKNYANRNVLDGMSKLDELVQSPTPKHSNIHRKITSETTDDSSTNELHKIPEKEANQVIDELAEESMYENQVKTMITRNENLEKFEREKAFKSVDEPVQDPVVVEEIMTRKFTQGVVPGTNHGVTLGGLVSHGLGNVTKASTNNASADYVGESYDDFYEEEYQRETYAKKNDQDDGGIDEENDKGVSNEKEEEKIDDEEGDFSNDIDETVDEINPMSYAQNDHKSEEEYTEEEYLAAQKKLDELVKQKEEEILRDMIRNGELDETKAGDVFTPPVESNDIDVSRGDVEPLEKTGSSLTNVTASQPVDGQIKNSSHNSQVTEPEQVETNGEIVSDIETATSVYSADKEIVATDNDSIQKSKELLVASSKEIQLPESESNIETNAAVDTDENIGFGSDKSDAANGTVDVATGVAASVDVASDDIATAAVDINTSADADADADVVFHGKAPLSTQTSNVESLNIADADDNFFTPPITPVIETPADERSEQFSDIQSLATGNTFKRSESPESSMLPNSSISYGTAPFNIPKSNKSMAQHLKPVMGLNNFSHAKPLQTERQNSNENGHKFSNDIKCSGNKDSESFEKLKVPKREPSIQAKIDYAERRKTLTLAAQSSEDSLISSDQGSNMQPVQPEKSTNANLNRRKSALKKPTNCTSTIYSASNQQSNASDAYLSLATAQNTKLNSITPLNAGPVSNRRQSIGAGQDLSHNTRSRSRSGSAASNTNVQGGTSNVTPLVAAAKAAQRHSMQPASSSGYGIGSGIYENGDKKLKRNSTANFGVRDVNNNIITANVGGVKAPNPKVEEAKRRILQNRPGKSRAKELYELSKTRTPVKSDDLIALQDPLYAGRSSFEKTVEPNSTDNQSGNINKTEGRMTSLLLRDNTLNYDNYERKRYTNGYKSRFADDNSDTDIPLPPVTTQPVSSGAANNFTSDVTKTQTFSTAKFTPSEETPSNNEKIKSGFKFRFANKKKSKADLDISTPVNNIQSEITAPQITDPKTNSSQKTHSAFRGFSHNQSDSLPRKESKFEKFFTEKHGPSDKRIVSSTSAVTIDSSNPEGKKKKGFLKKMFSDRNA